MNETIPAVRPIAKGMRLAPIGDAIPVQDIDRIIADGNDSWMYSTFPPEMADSFAGAARLVKIRRGNAVHLGDLLEMELVIHHVLVHPAASPDEQGEIRKFPRVLLIDHEDGVVDCCSMSAMQAVNELSAALKMPLPFTPPLRVKVHQKITTPPNRVYWFEPLGVVDETSGKKAKAKA